jgi:hypothetical protein
LHLKPCRMSGWRKNNLRNKWSSGGSKAKWFIQAPSYTKDNLGNLAKQIVFDPTKALETGITQYGTKYNQVITIIGANGKQIDVTFA